MKSIVMFGTGNVATHLYRALSKTENFDVIQIFNHSNASLEPFSGEVPVTNSLDEILPADFYLLAIRDETITSIATKLAGTKAFVIHTSGSIPLSALESIEKRGVLYPLQTFSKERAVNYREIPMCLEAGNEQQLKELEELAKEISPEIFHFSSGQRKALHVAAVFVSNFVNHLYVQGEEICRENDIPFRVMLPLIRETAAKVGDLSPQKAQTGPAKRGDQEVLSSHLAQLDGYPQKIYSLLTQSIQNLHGEEL